MKNLMFTLLTVLFLNNIYSQPNSDAFDIARKGNVEQAKELIKKNPKAFADANADGYSALILACYHGNLEMAKFLIDNKADINGSSKMGTPLMAAAVKKDLPIVKLLLEKKADPNIADTNGTTALMYATMFKSYDIVRLLIAAKANPDFKDNNGKSSLDYAIIANDDKLIETLKTK